MAEDDIRRYEVAARTTEIFGRVLCSARNHHFIIDGPVQNGCPGEAVTPVEAFLSGVAACGVELMQVLAKEQGIPLAALGIDVTGVIDRSNPVHKDLTVFNTVEIKFQFRGVDESQAVQLIDGFRARCPLLGTVAVATPQLSFEILTEPTQPLHSISLGSAPAEPKLGLHAIKTSTPQAEPKLGLHSIKPGPKK